ncbi:uncharacterized protein LOC107620718 [Arachis ipaensis]|uniref:uncharacterized protein LOC107620718 n=1 Tax=Arachis ipaensis TaxID=130454 RepID=UPI0007AFBA74|nr:uncharacterized protein LOC107620718 [Arachis ipaensis]
MDDTLRIILQEKRELHSIIQEQRDFQRKQYLYLATLTEVISRMALPTTSNQSTFQPSSSSELPYQSLPNPKGSINAVSLRSDTILQERSSKESKANEAILDEDIVEVEDVDNKEEVKEVIQEEVAQARESGPKEEDALKEAMPIPFPAVAKRTKKQVQLDPKMVDIFKNVEVIILLFYAIRQVPKYDKFLKDLCMNKEKINELENDVEFVDCMCDLGACVIIMPFSAYNELDLPPLKRSAARFVLADKSIIFVAGITEDVLVSIKGLAFPIDFYILEMPPNDFGKPSSILLGRLFLKTSRFKLDAFLGTYSFEIDGRTVSLNLDETMTHPLEDRSILRCDLIDEVVVEIHHETPHEMSMNKGLSVGEGL